MHRFTFQSTHGTHHQLRLIVTKNSSHINVHLISAILWLIVPTQSHTQYINMFIPFPTFPFQISFCKAFRQPNDTTMHNQLHMLTTACSYSSTLQCICSVYSLPYYPSSLRNYFCILTSGYKYSRIQLNYLHDGYRTRT